mmetsp:Transcript_67006/g.195929  ORF Transcript_67006/g.195929 Transcript_67006/m.195929 type:complete len:359 (-) Transcript_67006:89-1165(-)
MEGGAAVGELLDSARAPLPAKRPRFGEPQKFLPVVFVVFTISTLYCIYVRFHCAPMLQLGPWRRPGGVDMDARWRGIVETLVFHYITALLLVCYVRSVLVHPGEIPENDAQWQYLPQDGRSTPSLVPMGLQEMKRTGLRRHCKWCGKYKPDRCHHCRVCKTCILKMDHHCPWIYNCVGFANYKFFFLLLFYSVSDCHLIVWSMFESVRRCIDNPDTPFVELFFTFFGETLALFLTVLLTMFFGFHIWLMFKAMTTIEFCEKSLPKKDGEGASRSYDSSVYDLGVFGNVRTVLGPNIFLWFFPCSRPAGDGLSFVSEETRLTKEMESGKGIRRRTHQKTQRMQRRYGNELGLGAYDPRH